MPTEPERDIEKQLRAYAKERRERAGPPIEMHPATRKMLQSEAARLKAKGAGPSTVWSWLPGIWPQLTFGASIAAALMLACWLMLPVSSRPRPESKLAENLKRPATREAEINQPAPAAPQRSLAEAPPPVTSEVDSLKAPVTNLLAYDDNRLGVGGLASGELARSKDIADKKSKVELQTGVVSGEPALAPAQNPVPARIDLAKNLDQKEVAQTTAAPAAAATTLNGRAGGLPALSASAPPVSATAESVSEEFRKRYGRFVANGSVSAGTTNATAPGEKFALQESAGRLSLAPPAAPNQRTLAYGLGLGANGATQQFFAKTDSASAGRRYLASAGANPVLNSFRVEQNGNEIRVIDGDGSVYTGQVQVAAPPAGSPVLAESEALAAEKQTQLRADAAFKNVTRDVENKAIPDYSFHVRGTNRSINQAVVFSGRFLTGTNANQRLPIGTTTGFNSGTNAPGVPLAGSLSNLQIEGRAVVGGTNQFQIIAAPAGP